MAKGRRNKSKHTASKQNNKEIQVIILVVVSIILTILIYLKSAYIGENLSPFLRRNNRMD